MRIESTVIRALAYHGVASPLIVGDTIGVDKFRVLKIMRGLVHKGIIKPLWKEGDYESDRVTSDRQHYFIPGVSDSARASEPDYLLGRLRLLDEALGEQRRFNGHVPAGVAETATTAGRSQAL